MDGGLTWDEAQLTHVRSAYAWQQRHYRWNRPKAGSYELLARATDETGVVQPAQAPYNTLGYLFGAVVRHPVAVV